MAVGFISYLLELLAPFGNVRAKKMFGGHGIFKDELMFGLVAEEALDNSDDMLTWAGKSFAAAIRSGTRKGVGR